MIVLLFTIFTFDNNRPIKGIMFAKSMAYQNNKKIIERVQSIDCL